MDSWGQLTTIDLFDCDKEILKSGEKLKEFCSNLCDEIGMVSVGDVHVERFGVGDIEGWSAMQFIETSTITVHLDEVGGRAFIDIFSCKKFDSSKAEDFCKGFWGAGRSGGKTLMRG